MIAHCLTIPRNKARRDAIRKAWAGWNVRFHMSLDYKFFECEGFVTQWGQACCTYGHAIIWSRLEGIGPHLVIEDDAVPTGDITQAIELFQQCDYEIAKLHHYVDGGEPLRIIPIGRDNWISTTAYLIRNPQQVLRRLRNDPIDRQLQEIADVAAVVPRCVDSGRETGCESSIDYSTLSPG